MKTKILLIAAIALSVALLSCQKENITPASNDATVKSATPDNVISAIPDGNVQYVVNVVMSSEASICGKYQVEIVNGAGNLVAPGQPFNINKHVYTFSEMTHQQSGIRIAKIEPVSLPDGFQCDRLMYTPPDVHWIEFVVDDPHFAYVYDFELFPQTNPPIPAE